MLCTVFLVAMVWYRWHLLHHPFEVVSRSTLFLSTCEKVMRGILAFRPGAFYGDGKPVALSRNGEGTYD